MISEKTLLSIEYNKILSLLERYAVLEKTKAEINSFMPVSDFSDAQFLLNKTQEAHKLLYIYNLPSVYYFDDIEEELKRVDAGGVLNCGELLKVMGNLKSARIAKTSFDTYSDESITILSELSKGLYINEAFEKEIGDKILSEDEISDNASPKLYSIRKSIRNINAKIREQLNSYMRGNLSKYLQNSVVTMRQDRFVIPVKSEYRSFVKGFIHDQSSSGATVFIEPEQVMELNNDLKRAIFDEAEEIAKILAELSARVSTMSTALRFNAEILSELDLCYSRARYAYETKSTYPKLNQNGVINIIKGRHPLINPQTVVPVNVDFCGNNFLLISGPNTGGKTITLKMVGLFCLMAMSGMFIPAYDGSEVSVFNNVYCDIGDGQSIEQSLSTFSSHIANIIEIVNNADDKSLVLIDEIGAGTDPEEGAPLALAIIKSLLEKNCFGIITTHYAKLKEFAVDNDKIENACMEFDPKTLSSLYKLNVGMPGSSNAIAIAKNLGLNREIVEDAESMVDSSALSFEGVLRRAEETRREYENLQEEISIIKKTQQLELERIQAEKDLILKEKEKIYQTAKQETKRIVADKLAEAEEIVDELKKILKNAELESKEVFRASELKNRIKNSRYLTIEGDNAPVVMKKAEQAGLKIGNKVYVKSLSAYGKIISINEKKKESEILIGDIRTVVKLSELFNSEEEKKPKSNVKIFKSTAGSDGSVPQLEINVIGKTELEALTEVENFIDSAIVNGIEEVKIIHGVGKGILLKAIRGYLKSNKNIVEYRRGKYGEGENGVTIAKLK